MPISAYTFRTCKIMRKRTCFWITLGVCLFGMFIFASKIALSPYSARDYRQGYTAEGIGHRVHTMHKTYTTPKPEMPVKECSHSSRLCSENAIRNCLVASDYFPNEAHWRNSNASFPDSRFDPGFCRFKYDVIPPRLLQRCLQQKQMKRIVVIGDSNGSRYFQMLKKILHSIANCTTVRSAFSDEYFVRRRRRRSVTFPKQKPHWRLNGLVECVFLNQSDQISNHNEASVTFPQSVFIEVITVISFTDKELSNPHTNCSTDPVNGTKQCTKAEPRMLYPTMFGDYFARENNYPDVILMFSNSHDKGTGKNLTKTRADMVALRDVIRRYVPRSTALYWFSQLSENDSKKRHEWQIVLYENKYTANEMLVRLNRAMYDILRDDFRKGRIRTFFDLYAMTLAVPDWSLDGVHLKQDWYSYVLSYWFQTTCSEFM